MGVSSARVGAGGPVMRVPTAADDALVPVCAKCGRSCPDPAWRQAAADGRCYVCTSPGRFLVMPARFWNQQWRDLRMLQRIAWGMPEVTVEGSGLPVRGDDENEPDE